MKENTSVETLNLPEDLTKKLIRYGIGSLEVLWYADENAPREKQDAIHYLRALSPKRIEELSVKAFKWRTFKKDSKAKAREVKRNQVVETVPMLVKIKGETRNYKKFTTWLEIEQDRTRHQLVMQISKQYGIKPNKAGQIVGRIIREKCSLEEALDWFRNKKPSAYQKILTLNPK